MEKTPRWQATALAVAAAVAIGAWGSDAHALALGRITVQSALGEPLRADIDIPDINAEEAASLRASVASADAFKAAGLEYNPAMGNLQITLQRRADGRMFLRLTGDRIVNDPFIDLILEANWSSGRIVRDYTMLFDPPNLRQGTPPVPTAPQTSPPPSAALPPVPVAPRPTFVSPPAAVSVAPPVTRSPAARPAPAPSASRPAPAPAPVARAPAPAGAKKVTVQAGDTAGRIAAANKPASVSLDQMLVALLRANPDAFIGNNINRIRAGAVLEVPSAEQAASISNGEAGQTIVAQSKDFNDFRQRLAQGVATTQAPGANRQASGKLQAKVEDRKPAAATPDKLTLSKGATATTKANEDRIARDRQAKDAATRVAELSKNISDLSRLTATPGAAGTTPAGAASAARPGMAVPTGTPAATAASAAKAAASAVAPAMAAAAAASTAASAAKAVAVAVAAAPATAPAPAPVATPAPTPAPVAAPAIPAILPASASAAGASAASPTPAPAAMAASAPATASVAASPAPAASAPKPVVAKAPAAPPPPPETSLLDDLLENPIVPAAGVGLLALLLGFGFYRARQRKKSAQVDSSFLESRLQPDSFFGASGGQRIDTNEGGPTGSSMVYSPSQLDAAGDVDPVAEADVYLAYGRDLQAEEILKEAMRTSPTRVAIHSKLLEIYAKRRDAKAFEFVATEAHSLTHGEGPDWEHICELGQELDPSNPLYRGGQPPPPASLSDGIMSDDEPHGFAQATQPQMIAPEFAQSQPVDLDLDLDFSIGDSPASEPTQTLSAYATPPEQSTVAIPAIPEPPSLDMDFGSGTVALPPSPPPAPAPSAPDLSFDIEPVMLDAPDLTLSENDLAFTTEPPKAPPPPAPRAAPPEPPAAPDSGMIEFDMGSFSLDLPPAPTPAPAPAPTPSAPLAMPELDQHDIDTAGAPLSTSGAPLSTQGFDDTGDDPLGTKLALAEEFNAIGDPDGARSLAEEVVAEATGALKARAQRFLAELG